MTTSDWIIAISAGTTAVVALIVAMRRTIEGLLGQRLDDLQEGVTKLNAKSDSHGNRLTRVETVLELNGCFTDAACDRRKGA